MSIPTAPSMCERPPAARFHSDMPYRARLAGEWAQTSACCRCSCSLSTSSTSATIILYIDPVLPRPLPTISRGVHAPHAHWSVRAARRSDRAAERDLWTCSACVKCSAERAETDGMMQVGEKAQTAAQGTANPACGSRGMSCDFAVLHAFGASELETFQTSRMLPFLTCAVTIMQECCAQYLR